MSPAFAGTVKASDAHSCSVPPGNYVASSLGAGLDQLVLTVGGGEITASYTIQDTSTAGFAAAHWLDSSNASITCRGESFAINFGFGQYALSLRGHWNDVRQGVDIQGSYSGLSSTSRTMIKGALLMAAVGGMAYEGWYLYSHQNDIRMFIDTWRQARQVDSNFFAHPLMTRLGSVVGINVAGTGMRAWRNTVTEYLLTTHLYDFTVPAVASLVSLFSGGVLSRYGRVSLSGFGARMEDVSDTGSCGIPDGVYQGRITDHPTELWRLSVSLAQGTLKQVEITGVAESGNHTMTIRPSRFQCRGDRLSLEWLQSSPNSSTGKLVLFHSDKGILEGSGVVQPADGWLWRSDSVVMARVRLLAE